MNTKKGADGRGRFFTQIGGTVDIYLYGRKKEGASGPGFLGKRLTAVVETRFPVRI
jgi:hypothetical protein